MNKIAIGADHAGFFLKDVCVKWLQDHHIEVLDLGTFSEDSVDYPDYTYKVVDTLKTGGVNIGILICGSGEGMVMGANRFKGIRAALCWNKKSACLSRSHNDANILVLGARLISISSALQCLDAFINTPFSREARHLRRIKKLDAF